MNGHVPEPTVWPAALATGATLAAAGLITSPLVFAAGALLVVAALVGWVRLLTAERER